MRVFIAFIALALAVAALPAHPDDVVPETSIETSIETSAKCKSYCAKKLLANNKPCKWKSGNCAACPQCQAGYKPAWALSPCPRTASLPVSSKKKPADVLPSLKTSWKLQLPCKDHTCSTSPTKITNTGPASVSMKDLKEYSLVPRGYQAHGKQFCTGGFYASKDGTEDMVVLYDPVSGVTTGGSVNPRVELREMKSNKQKGGFNMQRGKHTLHMTQRIMHLPAKRKSVCFVQLFDEGYGAFVEVMTRICSGRETMAYDKTKKCTKGKLYTMVFHRDSNTHKIDYTMLAEYHLGTKFTLDVVVERGIMKFVYKPQLGGPMGLHGDAPVTYTAHCNDEKKCGSKNAVIYFKTGAYLQKAPEEENDDYVLSYQYAAKITHS